MKVLVVGKDARAHALVAKIAQSPKNPEIFCAPGNAGIARLAKCVNIGIGDTMGHAYFAYQNNIDLTVVSPELPLTFGIAEDFKKYGQKIVGPSRSAAILEGSKIFACEFMERNKIPTPKFKVFLFRDFIQAKDYICKHPKGVVKVDGLAGGKGVIIYNNEAEGIAAIEKIMIRKEFGTAGYGIVIQEFVSGNEATLVVATDGTIAIPISSAQDYKKAKNRNKGLNTGGMGSRAPATDVVTEDLEGEIMDSIIYPTLRGMRKEGTPFVGFLYAGLMIVPQGSGKKPKILVLEFNCRLGDPEWSAQSLLWESDIIPLLEAMADGNLTGQEIKWSNNKAVCVVMASKGYPGKYETGKIIKGLDEAAKMKDVVVFHSGTKEKDGEILTDGGRVLEVTAIGATTEEARNLAYLAVAKISWNDEYHRTDIAV